jgi:hypothetical protein
MGIYNVITELELKGCSQFAGGVCGNNPRFGDEATGACVAAASSAPGSYENAWMRDRSRSPSTASVRCAQWADSAGHAAGSHSSGPTMNPPGGGE